MIRFVRVIAHCMIPVCSTILVGFAQAASSPIPRQLTNAELDAVAAGVFATAGGTATADGNSARTEVVLTAAAARLEGQNLAGAAVGQASASATSNASPAASVNATLSLSVTLP